MTQLLPELRAIVLASRASMEPSAVDLAGGRARLIAALAAGVATAAATGGASAATSTGGASAATSTGGAGAATAAGAGGAALKIGAVVIGVTAAVGGGTAVVDRLSAPPSHVARAPHVTPVATPDRVARPRVQPAPQVTPIIAPAEMVPTIEPPAIAPTIEPSPASVANARPRGPSTASVSVTEAVPVPVSVTEPVTEPVTDSVTEPVPDAVTAPAPAAAPSSLTIELALLESARRAIRAADYRAARSLLDAHLTRFPNGQLAAERSRLARTLPPLSDAERTTP